MLLRLPYLALMNVFTRAHSHERTCATAGRGLNLDEWNAYLPGVTYQDTYKETN